MYCAASVRSTLHILASRASNAWYNNNDNNNDNNNNSNTNTNTNTNTNNDKGLIKIIPIKQLTLTLILTSSNDNNTNNGTRCKFSGCPSLGIHLAEQLSRSAAKGYARSPSEDSRLFGPSPWKILATTGEKKGS